METLHILMIGGFVPWYPKAGGGHVITYKISEAIAGLGHSVDYIAIAPKELQRRIEWSRDTIYIETNDWITQLKDAIKNQRQLSNYYDVVHIHEGNDTVGYGFGNYIMRMVNTDTTITCLSIYTPNAHKIPRSVAEFFWKFISGSSDVIYTLSEFSKNNISQAYNVPKAKIHTTYAGVDEGFLRAGKHHEKRDHNDSFSIMFVGRLAGIQKGVDILLESLSILIKEKRYNDIKVNIIGEGPDKEKYKQLAYRLGVLDYVNFIGFVPHGRLPEYYTQSDLLVLPSRRESFGLVLAEAMAVGLPVVSTRVGAIPEVVKDGKTGILVPPNDPQSLAEAMSYLLDHPTRRKKMGREGQKLVRKEFTWEKVAKRVVRGYTQVLL